MVLPRADVKEFDMKVTADGGVGKTFGSNNPGPASPDQAWGLSNETVEATEASESPELL